MIKWAVIGTFMAIAWLIQARVNEHDRLSKRIFESLGFGKIYLETGSQFFSNNPEDLSLGVKNFEVRIISLLKDTYTHRQMKVILRDYDQNKVLAQSKTTEIRAQAKAIAKQVAKSYAAMLQSPSSDMSSRRRRRR